MCHVHVVCDSATRQFMPNTEIRNLALRTAFAFTFALLSVAFGCFCSLSLLRQLCSPLLRVQALQSSRCCSDQHGPLVRQGADHVLTLGLARRLTHNWLQRYLAFGVPLPKFVTYKSGPCSLPLSGATEAWDPVSPKPATANPSPSEESQIDCYVALGACNI
jgi:hypothetical protein